MKKFKSYFLFSNEHRSGIFLLLLLIVIMQGVYFFVDFSPATDSDNLKLAQRNWLALQQDIDSVKWSKSNRTAKMYPFNPNYITDFKGYQLGMTVTEIDRLLSFRKNGKFVNSAQEFQQVTRVSDSLLNEISPFFKFPDWVTAKKTRDKSFFKNKYYKRVSIEILDINQADKETLMTIYGIGDKLSDRILSEREKLGAFKSMAQLNDIWGLSPEVLRELNKHFVIKSTSNAKTININSASIKELSNFPFFRYALAKDIVAYRTMNGDITTEDLLKIKGFPVDKIEIIKLYLEL